MLREPILFPYYSAEFDRFSEKPSESEAKIIFELLNSRRLEAEIARGNITMAIIRPCIGGLINIPGLGDMHIAQALESSVADLGVVAKFSIRLNESIIDKLYNGEPKQFMLKQAAVNRFARNRWEEFSTSMTRGNSTILLLHSPYGDAIEEFRRQLGHWDVDMNRDKDTIRGRFASSSINDLIHGSDSVSSLISELALIAQCVLGLIGEKSNTTTSFN